MSLNDAELTEYWMPDGEAQVIYEHPDDLPVRRLWASVFRLATQDAAAGMRTLKKLANKKEDVSVVDIRNHTHRTAVQWFFSDNGGAGTFVWLCDMFGFDPAAARLRLRENHAFIEDTPV